MAYVNAGKVGEFEDGEPKVCLLPGTGAIAVVQIDGGFYAFSNFCTHEGTSLVFGYGDLHGKTITCMMHNASFNVEDGRVIGGPADDPLTTYQVKIDGDDVMVGKD
jgi:3-phenylpropionate/trans-cinnamate dioxygenase ferredoxin subunit